MSMQLFLQRHLVWHALFYELITLGFRAGVLSPTYFWEVTQTCMFMEKIY